MARAPRQTGAKLKVGLVWAGNPQHGNDHNRSFRPHAFKPLFEIPDVAFFSLQKQQRPSDAGDLAQLGAIVDLAAELKDFSDSAAALAALDLLVAADTSIVHLAGALGRPVWTMVPFSPDWRWLTARDDTPWYPTMRLYRQPHEKDWGSVMRRVAEDLRVFQALTDAAVTRRCRPRACSCSRSPSWSAACRTSRCRSPSRCRCRR
jgi:hypothetical protein